MGEPDKNTLYNLMVESHIRTVRLYGSLPSWSKVHGNVGKSSATFFLKLPGEYPTETLMEHIMLRF